MILVATAVALLSSSPEAATFPRTLATCLGTTRYALNIERARAAHASLSEAEWRDACRQARDANARRVSATRALFQTGRSPVGGYAQTIQWMEHARTAGDPDVAVLFQHAAREQAARESLGYASKLTFAQGLSPTALMLLDGLVAIDAVEADAANRQWLRATVARRGWFTIDRDGEAADDAAGLIVQHADADNDFKREMIAVLDPLIRTGQTSPGHFAYIYDRWAAATGQPQRFGLQGRCVKPGIWEPRPIADPETLDSRRREAGLSPMIDFKAQQSEACA